MSIDRFTWRGERHEYAILFGNTWEDFSENTNFFTKFLVDHDQPSHFFLLIVIISGSLFSLWGFIFCLYTMVLKANIDTDEIHTALWMFFFVFMLFAFMVGSSVMIGQRERTKKEQEELERVEKAEDGEDHEHDDDDEIPTNPYSGMF